MTKWNRRYFQDLAERVGSTAIYGLIAVLSGNASGAIPNEPVVWWTVIGLPTVLCALKGLAANMRTPETGASLLPAPGDDVAPAG